MKPNVLNKHLKEVKKGYFEHMIFALNFIPLLILALITITIHSFLPFLFTNTTSNIIKTLNNRIDFTLNK